MISAKKIIQILSLIFLCLSIASCEEGCVEADQFDSESVTIDSKPTNDTIYGTYDPIDGGQRADWHNTGLKSNGDRFIIQISGAWTPWNGDEMDDTTLNALPRCNFCAKRPNTTPNCICYTGQTPEPEEGPDGNPKAVDCTTTANQNNPQSCTCTKDPQWGTVLDYPVYHFALDYADKDEITLIADRQEMCKYDRGMGAYVGLFGNKGVEVPTRAYHLFSEEEVCNVVRDSQNRCLDSSGNDVTKYVFRSANNRIFMKNDNDGNNGNNTNTTNDQYHGPNEVIKFIIYDRYYYDNYGKYNLNILRGVGNDADGGLLEYLVSTVESVVLGDYDSNGERQGGIIQFMYKAIVQDSGFIWVVQTALALYIALYGAASLFGVVELNKKELMNRTLKIGLIVLFTSRDSWYWYNKIIVSFFKDSMDYVVAMMLDLFDRNIDPSSMIKIAQMDRDAAYSNATRFSYIDTIIKNMMSLSTAKKVFGLFFGAPFFGLLYIPIIYALIAYFIYSMLMVAATYMVTVMKMIFVLALGPIFICFTLFTHTAGMFKKWLAFVGGRSLEIIILFAVLYNFLTLIDKGFTDLLSYPSCVEVYNLQIFSIKILKADINRDLITWLVGFLNIAGLIFIMNLVLAKVGDVAGSLISIGGESAKEGGLSSSMAMAGGMMGAALGLAQKAGGVLGEGAGFAARMGAQGALGAARASGLTDAWNKATAGLPRSPYTRVGDSMMDAAINKAKADAKASGLTGKEADAAVRKNAVAALQTQMAASPNKFAMAGVDMNRISQRLDQRLVQEPLKDFIKAEAKRLKSQSPDKIPLGKDMRQQLRANAEKFAKENFSAGHDGVAGHLKDMKNLIRNQGELGSSQAAKLFAGNEDLKNKYLQHLNNEAFRSHRKSEEAKKHTASWLYDLGKQGYHAAKRDNASLMQEKFLRKVNYEEKGGNKLLDKVGINSAKGFDPTRRFSPLDMQRKDVRDNVNAGQKAALDNYLSKDFAKSDNDKKNKREEERRAFYQQQLADRATKDMKKEFAAIRKLEKSGDEGKMKQAADRKMAMFNAMKEGLDKKDGRTMYDKAAQLAYMQKQLGLKDVKDPRLALAEAVSRKTNIGTKSIEFGSKFGSSTKDSQKAADKLKDQRAGLFDKELKAGGKSASEILDENMKKMEEALKANKPLEKEDVKENEKIDRDAIAAVNKLQKEDQEKLDALNAQLKEKEEKEKADKEEKEKADRKPTKEELDEKATKDAKEKEVEYVDAKKQMAAMLSEIAALKDSGDSDKLEEAKKLSKELGELIVKEFGGKDNERIEALKSHIENLGDKISAIDIRMMELKAETTLSPEEKASFASTLKSEMSGLIADSFSIDFGASITGALLPTDIDVGLKGSNVFLGVPDADKKGVDHGLLASLNVDKNQADMMLKMAKTNEKIVQFQIDELKKDPIKNKDQIASLEAELRSEQKNIEKYGKQVADIETNIAKVGK